MKTKVMILFFAVLSLSQVSWSQRVDNGTEGLALSNADELPRGSEQERLLAAFLRGNAPSEGFLSAFRHEEIIEFISTNGLEEQLVSFGKRKHHISNFSVRLLNQGPLLSDRYLIETIGFRLGLIGLEYEFSEKYNCLLWENSDGSRKIVFREYMGTLIGLRIVLKDLESSNNKIPEARIIKEFSNGQYVAVVQGIVYIFKPK